MKRKMKGVLGVVLALVLISGMMAFALPASAGAYEPMTPETNEWEDCIPSEADLGSYFWDSLIGQVGPIAVDKNNEALYAYVDGAQSLVIAPAPGDDELFKSLDGGRTWFYSTEDFSYGGAIIDGGPIVEIVCSEQSEDVVYVTDGQYVYKSFDGGMNFMPLAADSLETALGDDPVVAGSITCMDVGYLASGDSLVFIGVNNAATNGPSVFYFNEGAYSSAWTDLVLGTYDPDLDGGDYTPYAVGCAPDFATSKKTYVAVTRGGAVDRTFIISTVGIEEEWNALSELWWDCDDETPNNFEIRWASRFAFPDDFDATKTMFIGVSGDGTVNGLGGDVYRVADDMDPTTIALDLNVNPGYGGCTGLHANICSLDMIGNTDSGSLMAGALDDTELDLGAGATEYQSPVEVYYSNNGGWTWDAADKDPTGTDTTYVLYYGTATEGFAATNGCDCAFSMSCGDLIGQYFNQISLISFDILELLDLSFGPTYATGVETMFALVSDTDSCAEGGELRSLLRWDGSYWERVHSSRYWKQEQAEPDFLVAPLYDWVEQSPDFDDTACVYMANTVSQMTRSLSAGCNWVPLYYPCTDRFISAWIVVNETTVLTSGCDGPDADPPDDDDFSGLVFRTKTAGQQPWEEFEVEDCFVAAADCGVDFDISPDVENDDDVLLGDANGQVFFSSDLGETWLEISDATGIANFGDADTNTYVVFDPGYATAGDPGEGMVYAAAGTDVGRCVIDPDAASLCVSDWLYLSDNTMGDCDTFNLCEAAGIDIEGDPALYVLDSGIAAAEGPEADGTIEITCGLSFGYDADSDCCDAPDLDIEAEDVAVISGTFEDGELLQIIEYNLVCRVTECAGGECTCTIVGEIGVKGYESGAYGEIVFAEGDYEWTHACTCGGTDCWVGTEANATVASSYLRIETGGVVAACANGVWRTVNPHALIIEDSNLNFVEWEFLTDQLSNLAFLKHPMAPGLEAGIAVFPDDLWLTNASNVLWAIDTADCVYVPFGQPCETAMWVWEDPLATQVVQLSPADGTLLAFSTKVTLEWEALDAAIMYEVKVYEECPECLDPDEMKLVDTYYTSAVGETCIEVTGLEPGTKHFWKVRVACDSPYVSKWSDIWSFDTALSTIAVLCSPECGASDIIPTTNFSWSEVIGATGYEIQIVAASADGTADFTGATTYTSDVNALASIPGLEYSTVYYWRVRAIKDGVASAWSVCLFTIMDVPEECPEPITPVTIVTEEVTPVWIWVIIGIGGALTIVVIILIVTTRKVS